MDSTVGLANRVSSRKNGFASSEAVLLTNIFSSAIWNQVFDNSQNKIAILKTFRVSTVSPVLERAIKQFGACRFLAIRCSINTKYRAALLQVPYWLFLSEEVEVEVFLVKKNKKSMKEEAQWVFLCCFRRAPLLTDHLYYCHCAHWLLPTREQLMTKGALDLAQYHPDFHRIFTEGVSRPVGIIRASTFQEMDSCRLSR